MQNVVDGIANYASNTLNATSRAAERGKQMKEWKHVTKQELIDFLKEYPFPLEHDFYMDWHSWNDFRDGRQWPESMIAMASIYDDEFKIYDGYIQEKSEPPKEE